MSSIYDRTDIYDLLEDQTHWSAYKKHWKTLLQGKNVHSFLDVSIGSGSVTLPLCELGVQLAGSDLSEEMIRKWKEKISKCQNSNWLTGTVLWQKRMIKIKVLCGRNILNKAWKHFLSRRNRYWYCCH